MSTPVDDPTATGTLRDTASAPADAWPTGAEPNTTIDLVEEELVASTRPVQTGEVTFRREVVTETRTIQVPVHREELVIERHPVERRPQDAGDDSTRDPLIEQLMDRLRQMQDGETLRIPIIEEEVVVSKHPVVVEEVTVGKRSTTVVQTVSDTIRREELRVKQPGARPTRSQGDPDS